MPTPTPTPTPTVTPVLVLVLVVGLMLAYSTTLLTMHVCVSAGAVPSPNYAPFQPPARLFLLSSRCRQRLWSSSRRVYRS